MTKITKRPYITLLQILFLLFICPLIVRSQPELAGWGNLNGIRVEGHLMELNSSLMVAGSDWSELARTAKERQRPQFNRDGEKQVVATGLADILSFTETVQGAGTGRATVDLKCSVLKDTVLQGAFFSLRLPGEEYSISGFGIKDPVEEPGNEAPVNENEILRARGSGFQFLSGERQLDVLTDPGTLIIIRHSGDETLELLMAIVTGSIEEGQIIEKRFEILVKGEIDRDPVEMVLDPSVTGRIFDGFGGNFRLQNPDTDPPVITYCLENMRVAWARVEMPWSFWHPEEGTDPLKAAREGDLHQRVKDAMENAQRIHRMGIPVIVSAWSGPDWAIVGRRSFGPRPDGLRGNPLDPEKMEEIYNSISAYLVFMKEEYGVEAEMFSFNESDLGIYIRQTSEEHRDLIKGLGAFFQSKGLKTKLLLGDTADANGWPFLKASLQDRGTLPYIGAVSFHSWRGWETETLEHWSDAAITTGKPLIVGEGSTDAAAWNYPDIFQEQVYIMEEINLYIRILDICQPKTILQWQLTADYSPMAGGGIFGDDGPLRPIQRFWNMKQLASTPAGLAYIPIASNHEDVTCAALGNQMKSNYAFHVVNNGAGREAVINGIPEEVKDFRVVITDSRRGMEEQDNVEVEDGRVRLNLPPMSYVTLVAGEWDY